jgi:uncharacterized protein (TIGR02145 family)
MKTTRLIVLLIVTIFMLNACSDDNSPGGNNNGGGNNSGGCAGGPTTVTDIDGNVYNVVSIGNQCWMKENLKVSKYRNGDPIPTNPNNTNWQNTTSGAYAIYNNTTANNSIYGKLYNWYAVADPRGLCPTGWHEPSDAEWTTLRTHLGGDLIAGGAMKEAGLTHWASPNTDATNSSGFSGLPGGYVKNGGSYFGIGEYGNWWSSTENATTSAWACGLYYFEGMVSPFAIDKRYGYSVRCVRD